MYRAMAEKTGTRVQTMRRDTVRICWMRSPCRRPIAWDRFAVIPVDRPTQQAIIRISYGNDRPPTAAMAASPRVAANARSTKVNSDRIWNDRMSGAAIFRMEWEAEARPAAGPGLLSGGVIGTVPGSAAARHSNRDDEHRRGPGITMTWEGAWRAATEPSADVRRLASVRLAPASPARGEAVPPPGPPDRRRHRARVGGAHPPAGSLPGPLLGLAPRDPRSRPGTADVAPLPRPDAGRADD